MSKQITYIEPVRQFAVDTVEYLSDKMEIFSVIVKTLEEYSIHRTAILDPSRGITLIDPTELPEIPDPAWFTDELVNQFKAELASTDYKIVKCSEYQLAGLDMPYDVAELHRVRQGLRDRINEMDA